MYLCLIIYFYYNPSFFFVFARDHLLFKMDSLFFFLGKDQFVLINIINSIIYTFIEK